MSDLAGLRPAPDAVVVTGALASAAGYLLPWFRQSSFYDWSYSGWAYASLSSGGGWTLVTLAWLLLALVASLWAGRSVAAAMTAVVGGVGAAVSSLAVIAASFGNVPERGSINHIADFPVGVGLPLLAAGSGLLLAGGCRAIAVNALRNG